MFSKAARLIFVERYIDDGSRARAWHSSDEQSVIRIGIRRVVVVTVLPCRVCHRARLVGISCMRSPPASVTSFAAHISSALGSMENHPTRHVVTL